MIYVRGLRGDTLSSESACQYSLAAAGGKCAREYGKEIGRELKRERTRVKKKTKSVENKEVIDMEKENIYGEVTCYRYASYIGQINMSGPLGTITFFLQPKPNCPKNNSPGCIFFVFDFFIL